MVSIYRNGEVETVLEAPKLEIKYDKLAFQRRSDSEIKVYEFGKPYKAVTSFSSEEEMLNKRYYCIIYVRLSRRKVSYVIEVECKRYKLILKNKQ